MLIVFINYYSGVLKNMLLKEIQEILNLVVKLPEAPSRKAMDDSVNRVLVNRDVEYPKFVNALRLLLESNPHAIKLTGDEWKLVRERLPNFNLGPGLEKKTRPALTGSTAKPRSYPAVDEVLKDKK